MTREKWSGWDRLRLGLQAVPTLRWLPTSTREAWPYLLGLALVAVGVTGLTGRAGRAGRAVRVELRLAAGRGVPVRTEPDRHARLLDRLEPGDMARARVVEPRWLRVVTEDGERGYVYLPALAED